VVIVDLATPDVAGVQASAALLKASKVLTEQPLVRSCETVDETLRLYVDNIETAIPQVMRALNDEGIEPAAIGSRRPSLDDVFLAKTGRSLAD
jgi:ABC-2 type transport system ATP-binding protein